MPTLVLSRRYTEDSSSMWRAALAAGWDVERLLSYEPPTDLPQRNPVIYGETLMADALAGPLGLTLLEPTLDWLATLPIAHVKRNIRATTLGAMRAVPERAFVKPVDEKIFQARVYAAGEHIDAERTFPDEAGVLVSEIVTFGLEVRAFVLEREVASLSAYMREGRIAKNDEGEWPLAEAERDEASAFLATVLADPAVRLPPAVVVDVGRAEGLGWVIVEANPCWASGLCGCDPRDLLPVMRRANVHTRALPETDKPWSRAGHTILWPEGP